MSVSIRRVMSAAPDLLLGGSYAITWVSPTALGARSFDYLLLMLLFEFIVIHSSAFMGMAILGDISRLKRVGIVLGFGLFYSTFVAAFAAIFHTWWPATAFAALTLNRLTPVLFGTRFTEDQSALQAAGWAISVGLYLVGAFATVLLPIPHLGVTADVIANAHLPGSGLWVEEPYRLLAFGAFYYLAQAAVELNGIGRAREEPAIVS
jgi:hypothetical protein